MSKTTSSVTAPQGFVAAGGTCGIKASGKPDLAIIASQVPAKVAAVFTTNAVVGAPVTIGKRHIKGGRGRAIVCNSGKANVATGSRGLNDAIRMCRATAKVLGCDPHDVLPSSTGVIGQFIPIDKIETGIADLGPKLARGPKADTAAAKAILTTDLCTKSARRTVKVGRTTVTLGGIAKGSGMIAPNMATMLGFITTDADLSAPLLQRALRDAVNADASFNRISVDTDTSTSDTVAVLANGAAGHTPIRTTGTAYRKFCDALADLSAELAYQIISDGEGVNHVIRVEVSGAASGPQAVLAARAIADSPLVKTAVHGHDPNWGRIAMAAGKSGARFNPDKMQIKIGRTPVFRSGKPVKFDAAKVSRAMRKPEVTIGVSLGAGKAGVVFLGCDLSREYIRINADYTT